MLKQAEAAAAETAAKKAGEASKPKPKKGSGAAAMDTN